MPLSTLPTGTERVVVLAMDDALRATIHQTLEVLGYRVTVATDTAELVAAVAAEPTDLVVVDVFSGATIPAQVSSVEFYRLAARLLSPRGALMVNVADGIGLPFARTQIATLRAALPDTAVIAETQVMKGRRFGNLVLVAANDARVEEWMPRLLAAGPHPAQAVAGDDVDRLIAGVPVVTDATATGSPEPGRGVFLES